MNSIKQKFFAWYDQNIQAGWYASLALIGGWATVAVAWLPEALQFIVDHMDFFGPLILPKMDDSTKAVVVSLYVAFGAPVLRAKIQTWMQRKAAQQQAKNAERALALEQ